MHKYYDFSNDKIVKKIIEMKSAKNQEEKEMLENEIFGELFSEYGSDFDSIYKNFLKISENFFRLYIPENCKKIFEEALFSYMNDRYISTISSIGMLAEAFCIYMFKMFLIKQNVKDQIITKRLQAFENISQFEKIEYLFAIGKLSEESYNLLHEIRKKRNDTIHPGKIYNQKEYAEDCIKLIFKILGKYTSMIKGE